MVSGMAAPTDASGWADVLMHHEMRATLARFTAFRINYVDPRYESLLRTVEPDPSGSFFVGTEPAPALTGGSGGAAGAKHGAK